MVGDVTNNFWSRSRAAGGGVCDVLVDGVCFVRRMSISSQQFDYWQVIFRHFF